MDSNLAAHIPRPEAVDLPSRRSVDGGAVCERGWNTREARRRY